MNLTAMVGEQAPVDDPLLVAFSIDGRRLLLSQRVVVSLESVTKISMGVQLSAISTLNMAYGVG